MDGFLIIDKPLGPSSRAAVDRVQKSLPGVRIGHTGTLDPLATGVLVLALGRGTRLAEFVQDQAKEYLAGVRLGATSATDDAEGPIVATDNAVLPSDETIANALRGFTGTISQTPPAFSAAHVDGRRAYKLARKGQAVELAPRDVRVDRIDWTRRSEADLDLSIQCGKGTYIRSLARDLGQRLGCGAYLTSLRRTRIGQFRVEAAVPLDASAEAFERSLRPLADAVVDLPRVDLDDPDIERLRHGQAIPIIRQPSPAAIFDRHGRFHAIADIIDETLRPRKVIS